jgi:hypothetical protein
MLPASLFDLLLNIALPVCPCVSSSHGSLPGFCLVPQQQQQQVRRAGACDGACDKPAKPALPAVCSLSFAARPTLCGGMFVSQDVMWLWLVR